MTKSQLKKALLEMGYRAINNNGELSILEQIKTNLKMIDLTINDIISIKKTIEGFMYVLNYGNETVTLYSIYSINDDLERIRDWVEWGSLNYR